LAKPSCCTNNSVRKTLVLSPQPPHEVVINAAPQGLQRRWIESTVIVQPTPKDRVEHLREVAQALVALELNMPATHSLPHDRQGLTTYGWQEVHIDATVLVDRFSRPESVAKKRELDNWVRLTPIDVGAIDDLRLPWMQFETALAQPRTELL